MMLYEGIENIDIWVGIGTPIVIKYQKLSFITFNKIALFSSSERLRNNHKVIICNFSEICCGLSAPSMRLGSFNLPRTFEC